MATDGTAHDIKPRSRDVTDGLERAAAGGYPLEFGTISVSDGISMGHEGMHFSLVSREVIADSVETRRGPQRDVPPRGGPGA